MTKDHDLENSSGKMPSVPEQSINGKLENRDRRKILKRIALKSTVLAGCSVLPHKWTSPIVEFGVLPAHAVTSGQNNLTEHGNYHGRYNGDRPTWYFSKRMKDYPQKLTVVVDGCAKVKITSHDGKRFSGGGLVVKQSHVTGRGMAVIAPSSCKSRTSHIVY